MNIYDLCGIRFYNFIYKYIDSNMYVILQSNKRAIIVDPHDSVELRNLLRNNYVEEVLIILTHEHPDHIQGVYYLSTNFNTTLVCQTFCAESIRCFKNNRPVLIDFILKKNDILNGTNYAELFRNEYNEFAYDADIIFDSYLHLTWDDLKFDFYHTPGHSKGSACILLNSSILFSGDTLFRDLPVITRFSGGSKSDYMNVAMPILSNIFANNAHVQVLPGHRDIFCARDIIHKGTLNVEFR